jgi:hypothetical protein
MPKKRPSTIIAAYPGDGDVCAIYDEFGPAWREGRDVIVVCGAVQYSYFDFVIATRLNDEEPASEIARFILSHRALRKTYVTPSFRLVRHYAKAIGRDQLNVAKTVSRFIRELDPT